MIRRESAALTGSREFCDQISAKYRAASSLFGIDHDDFVRTSEERHKEVVRRLWNR